MADQLPINFVSKPKSILNNVSWSDISDGVGYITLNGCFVKNSAGTTYSLTKNTPYSVETHYSYTGVVGTGEINIDTPTFLVPKYLRGDLIINACHGVDRTPAGGSSLVTKFRIYHVDSSSTETLIGSQWTSPTLTSAGGGNPVSAILLAVITCPRTLFEIGSKLRVEVQQTISTNDASDVELGLDPQNRDAIIITPSSNTSEITTFTVSAPFEVHD